MPQKRVLVVSQHFWPENFRINDIVEGFLESGIDVDVLCGLPNYPKGEWYSGYSYRGPRRENYKGAKLIRAGEIRRKNNTSLRIFLNYCSFPFFALFNLPRIRGKYQAVLCYETSPVMMLLPAIAYAKFHKIPLTGYVLDLWPDNLYSVLPVKSKAMRAIAASVSCWHYRKCDKLIALSGTQAQLLQSITGGKKKTPQIEIIPQYSEDFYAQKPQDSVLPIKPGTAFNILFAGNLSPAQDLENLFLALKQVKETPEGKDVQVFILGDGMAKDGLVQFVKQNGLAHAVTFCGQVPPGDIPKWTAGASTLYAGLAKSENLALTVPAKIASYMAAAKPLLVATGGEGAKAAAESGGALVSAPGDAAALAKNILALAAMPKQKLDDMGRASFEYYQKNYSRTEILAKLISFIFK